jgi:SAM-dependent methyltransferase
MSHSGDDIGQENGASAAPPQPTIPVTAQEWDNSYRAGLWTYLRNLDEMAHYSAICGYVRCAHHQSRILDIGCGEAVLFGYLGPEFDGRYAGVDWSGVAIANATSKCTGVDLFCSDIESFGAAYRGRKFDVIVFNEILYYLQNPIETVAHYERLLRREGTLIVSMCAYEHDREMSRKVARIWRELIQPQRSLLDSIRVTNERTSITWCIRAYRPAGGYELEETHAALQNVCSR